MFYCGEIYRFGARAIFCVGWVSTYELPFFPPLAPPPPPAAVLRRASSTGHIVPVCQTKLIYWIFHQTIKELLITCYWLSRRVDNGNLTRKYNLFVCLSPSMLSAIKIMIAFRMCYTELSKHEGSLDGYESQIYNSAIRWEVFFCRLFCDLLSLEVGLFLFMFSTFLLFFCFLLFLLLFFYSLFVCLGLVSSLSRKVVTIRVNISTSSG